MEKKYNEVVGVDNVHVALVLEDSLARYLAEAPVYFAPVAEITGEPEIEDKTTYYDNVAANNFVTEGKTPLKMVISGIPADVYAKYIGKYFKASTGRVYDTGKPNPPKVALSFRFDKGNGDYRYYQYLKGTFSGGTEDATTKKEGSVDVKTYSVTFTALSTTHQWDVDGENQPIKRIFGDTTTDAFNGSTWFDAVQTPDTDGTAGAFTLDSSVPADGGTGVAVDATLEATLSNVFTSAAVSLFKKADFTPVAVAVTADTTGKKVNVKPDGDLIAATDYVLILTEVTDIYGQTLSNQVIEFTTA